MRMLDIDMDFFQTGIHCFKNDSDNFLADENIEVWENKKIIDFLENSCGLNKNNKIKGRIVKHHAEAYSFWKGIINDCKYIVPFEVTHIDAHSDLAYSSSVPFHKFIKSLDSKESQEELSNGTIFESKEDLIDSGNYLLAAVINGWVERVKYVYHPDLDYIDVFEHIVENIKPGKLFRFNFCEYIKQKNIYLETISPTEFSNNERYDYATIALSPPYVKKEMESRLYVIKEYIEII